METLEDEWSEAFTPTFTAGWYDHEEELPQITVMHISTSKRSVFLTDDPTTTDRRCIGLYGIDVWSKEDEAQRWAMVEEVERIIKAKCNSLDGDIEWGDISGFVELDETRTNRKLLRSRATLEIIYWK
jgi:hypothetical protein